MDRRALNLEKIRDIDPVRQVPVQPLDAQALQRILDRAYAATDRPAVQPTTRGRRKLVAAVSVAIVVLAGAGTAIALSTNLLSQQRRFHALENAPDDPARIGSLVEVFTEPDAGVIAWRSNRGLCLDIAIPGNSVSGCGLPVVGAPSDATHPGEPAPRRQLGAVTAAGLLPNGETAVAGAVAPGVDAVKLRTASGAVLSAATVAAPPELKVPNRFFFIRIAPGEDATSLSAYRQGELLETDEAPAHP